MVPSHVSEDKPFVFQAPITTRDHNMFMRYQGYYVYLPSLLMTVLWPTLLGLLWIKSISWIANTSAKMDAFVFNEVLAFSLVILLLLGLTVHQLAHLKNVGIELASFFGPLDRTGHPRAPGVSIGSREVALYPDRIEFKMENLNEVYPLKDLGKTKRFHDLLMIPAGAMRHHLLRPALNATEINLLKQLLRRTRNQAQTAPLSKFTYDLDNDPDAISPDRTMLQSAVAEWQKVKNKPASSVWHSLFFLSIFAVCYPLFVGGAVTSLKSNALPHPFGIFAIFAMTVNLPRILREALALLNNMLRNGFPLGTNLGREEFEPGIMRIDGHHLSVYRAGYVLKLNLNSEIEAWEHGGVIIISNGDQPFAALPARGDLKRTLQRLGHLSLWGKTDVKTGHVPASRAWENATC